MYKKSRKKMTGYKKKAVIFATITAFIWGLSFLSIKVAVAVIPPVSLGFIRFVIASLILALVFIIKRKKPELALKDLPLMAGSGFIGVSLYFMGENNGVLLLSASEASIIVGSIPVLAMIAERIFVKSSISRAQYAGAALSVLGVSLLVIESLRLSPSPKGYFYMAVAAISWVAYAFMTKPLTAKYKAMDITFWHSLFGAMGFLPFIFGEKLKPAGIDLVVILNVLYLGIFCSALGYLFYITSVEALGPGVSSVFINLIPVVSVIASMLVLDEKLSSIQLFGGAGAIVGVYITSLTGSTYGKQKK
ncbi:DMT family transporter [Spirochaetota bacterium]